MRLQSQRGPILGLHGDLEGHRGQPRSTQNYFGVPGSRLQKGSTTVNWSIGRPRLFISQFIDCLKPFFATLKWANWAGWNEECDESLISIKQYLAEPPVLVSPEAGETLFVYLAVSDVLVSAALFKKDENKKKRPVFFVSKSLVDAEPGTTTSSRRH